jgi:hypothetical protein
MAIYPRSVSTLMVWCFVISTGAFCPNCSVNSETEGSSGTQFNTITSGASGQPGSTSMPASSTIQTALCAAKGQKQACYCPDGTMNGVQMCDEGGNLQPCGQCSTDKKAEMSNAAGLLCPDLESKLNCTAQNYQSEELPASILFVVDRSGSMSCNTPADGQSSADCETNAQRLNSNKPSKWEMTIAALKEVFNKLNQSGARVGLMFLSNNGICGVNSDLTLGGVPLKLIDQSQVSLLSLALDRQNPEGGTPLVGSTILAYKQLHQIAGGDCGAPPCGAPGNRFVVLFTDGVDSCPNPSFDGVPCEKNGNGQPCTQYLLDTEVKSALAANIRTYVIGAPGSENGRGFLSELAYQGGTAKTGCTHSTASGDVGDCHFDMTTSQDFATDLSTVLRAISGSAIGCEFAVPAVAGADPNNVNVQYTAPGTTPICIPRDDGKGCRDGANGWQFAKNPDGSANTSKVVLCGDACGTVSNVANVQVDVITGCESIRLD